MTHKYEIRQHVSGQYVLYEMSDGLDRPTHKADFDSLEAAELAVKRLVSPRIRKYDADGEEVE